MSILCATSEARPLVPNSRHSHLKLLFVPAPYHFSPPHVETDLETRDCVSRRKCNVMFVLMEHICCISTCAINDWADRIGLIYSITVFSHLERVDTIAKKRNTIILDCYLLLRIMKAEVGLRACEP